MKTGQNIVAEVFDTYRTVGLQFVDSTYWETLRTTYERTVDDVLRLTAGHLEPSRTRVLEIGSFCGIVATALRRCGFDVTACDLPLFMSDAALQKHYRSHAIHMVSGDMAQLPLSLEPDTFDFIICCEVIEHLNFNPLRTFCEFNRILRKGGVLYVSTPNQANIVKRLRLLGGRSIHNPVSPDLVWQLDPMATFSIGLHWREFTADELNQVMKLTGFRVIEQYYCHTNERRLSAPWRRWLVGMMYRVFPAFLPTQVAVGNKVNDRTTASLVDALK